MINFGLVAAAMNGPTIPILITSKLEEIRKRKNIKIRSFLFSPRTYRNLVGNEAIEESPILRKFSN